MTVRITIEAGEVRAFAAELDNAADRVGELAQMVLRKTAADIKRDAQALAPVDTGALRNSITYRVQGLEAEIGPTVHYGGFVEYGTSRMAPQPYLGPAMDRNLPIFEEALSRITGQF